MTGKDGVLTPRLKQIFEAALDGEMESHLTDCKKEDRSNRRNGLQSKTIKSGFGIKKRQTVLNASLDNKILSLYALGMSYDAITEHLAELYGLGVSSGKISQITNKSACNYRVA